MDFIDKLKHFSTRVKNLNEQILTEEATKTSLILPFFQMMGYDIFDPNQFVPEFTADTGIKKGEKVDYAIIEEGNPVILIEAKWCVAKLEKHDSQLFRYFGTTFAKFAILTNGIEYRFYTDLEQPNRMDEEPFLVINLIDLKESLIPELKKFQKDVFDLESISNSASDLKYSNQIKQLLQRQLMEPSDNFVTYVLGEVYSGRKTQKTIDGFKEIVRKSFNQFVNELIKDSLQSAIDKKEKELGQVEVKEDKPIEKAEPRIVTSEDELEGYFIVKSVLREVIKTERITHKDTESYFGILLDNNTRKWICRLSFGEAKKSLIIPDENKNSIYYPIANIEDIYDYKEKLIEVVQRYL